MVHTMGDKAVGDKDKDGDKETTSMNEGDDDDTDVDGDGDGDGGDDVVGALFRRFFHHFVRSVNNRRASVTITDRQLIETMQHAQEHNKHAHEHAYVVRVLV
jgi:hypothetical protein